VTCAAGTKANLAGKGLSMGPNDALIAAQAITCLMTLVTNNARQFSRITGLKLVNRLTP
jgi:tRNA(fMet)-specific endonuclease VapC